MIGLGGRIRRGQKHKMDKVEGLVQGLHHITLVTSNQEVNRRFYTNVLGLRRVKLTVNQDDIYHRHLFYANEQATTGSAITFFEWPDLQPGWTGLMSPHHLSYTVPSLEALPKWKSWLVSQGVSVIGPKVIDRRISLYLRDPDGVLVEITTPNSESVSAEYANELFRELRSSEGIGQDMRLSTFNHASPVTSDPQVTVQFFDKFLGLRNSFTRPNPDEQNTSIVAIGNENRPDFLRYLAASKAQDGYVGTGSIHHIAMAVEDEQEQRKIMDRLNAAGFQNSGVINRFWFKSLYFRDPDGNLLEIATKGPGYAVDEAQDKLGTRLVLPPWLEPRRAEIQTRLEETDRTNARTWPPKYLPLNPLPESVTQPGS